MCAHSRIDGNHWLKYLWGLMFVLFGQNKEFEDCDQGLGAKKKLLVPYWTRCKGKIHQFYTPRLMYSSRAALLSCVCVLAAVQKLFNESQRALSLKGVDVYQT